MRDGADGGGGRGAGWRTGTAMRNGSGTATTDGSPGTADGGGLTAVGKAASSDDGDGG